MSTLFLISHRCWVTRTCVCNISHHWIKWINAGTLFITWAFENKFSWNFNKYAMTFIKENSLVNVCKIAFICLCLNDSIFHPRKQFLIFRMYHCHVSVAFSFILDDPGQTYMKWQPMETLSTLLDYETIVCTACLYVPFIRFQCKSSWWLHQMETLFWVALSTKKKKISQ